MSRKFLAVAIVLAALFAGAAFAQTLGVVVYKDNPGQQVPTIKLVNQWAQEHNVKVDITTVTHSNRQTVLTTALQAGSGPDLVMMSNYDAYLYPDALLDISDVAQQLAQENGGWYPIAQQLGQVNGTWRAFPIYIYMHQMLYRKSVFQKAGIQQPPDTWAEFRTDLEKIKASGQKIEPFGVSYGRSFDGQQFLIGVLMGYGSKVLSDDGTKVVFDSPETVAGLKYAVQLYRDGLIDPTVVGWDDGTNNQAFLADRIAITFNGFSIKQQALTDFPDLAPDIGTAIYPRGPVTRVSFPTVLSYGIRKSTQHPELAKNLLAFLMSHDSMTTVLEATHGAIGVPFKGFADMSIWKEPDFGTNLTAIESAGLFAPPSAATAQVDNSFVLVDMLANVLVKGMTPEQAVKTAADQMNQIYFGTGSSN